MEPPHHHPYYPPSAAIAGFAPNETSLAALLAAFACAATAVVAAALRLAARQPPRDRFAAAWFALCGFLHVGFEGYYVVRRSALAGLQTLPAQLWKEYALSDARYLSDDAFIVCIETLTAAVWGPLCWLALAAVVRAWPARHALQAVVCTAHLYGVALYFGTALAARRLAGLHHCRPEPLYFWLYHVALNLPWLAVPLLLLHDSFTHVAAAFVALAQTTPPARAKLA